MSGVATTRRQVTSELDKGQDGAQRRGYDELTGLGTRVDGALMQPCFYLAYAPRGVGVAAALFYVVRQETVFGWYTGARNHGCESRFFALENYFSEVPTVYWHSVEDDVHGQWAAGRTAKLKQVHGPAPDAVCHELERLQSEFDDEWLFYAGDPRAAKEIDAYRRLELPVTQVNVRSCQFPRFDQTQPTWIYASPRSDLNVVARLGKRWALDYRG